MDKEKVKTQTTRSKTCEHKGYRRIEDKRRHPKDKG
ncbi:conserved hypothetical protein, partial [Trichinella spiralis]